MRLALDNNSGARSGSDRGTLRTAMYLSTGLNAAAIVRTTMKPGIGDGTGALSTSAGVLPTCVGACEWYGIAQCACHGKW